MSPSRRQAQQRAGSPLTAHMTSGLPACLLTPEWASGRAGLAWSMVGCAKATTDRKQLGLAGRTDRTKVAAIAQRAHIKAPGRAGSGTGGGIVTSPTTPGIPHARGERARARTVHGALHLSSCGLRFPVAARADDTQPRLHAVPSPEVALITTPRRHEGWHPAPSRSNPFPPPPKPSPSVGLVHARCISAQ